MTTKMRMIAAAAMLILGAALAASAREIQVPLRRFALVAGSNDGGEALVRLKYAESDARSFATVLQELGGVLPRDLLLVASPSLSRFRDALQRIRQMVASPREMDERREFVFYYSGHSDDDGLILGKDHVTWSDLRAFITDVPADVKIAILDSCSSGSLTRAKGGVPQPAFLFDASADMTGHAFLTSSSAEEAAQESDRIRSSFFTHFLISGLRGAADGAGDGTVTLNEAYSYAFQETLASTENTQYGPQHPAYDISLSGSGDLVLTDLRSASATVVIAEELAGRLYFRDAEGSLAVELNKAGGQKVELGLQPGTYSVVLDTKGSRLAGEVRVSSRQPVTLTRAALHSVPVDSTVARGDASDPAGTGDSAVNSADAGIVIASIVGAALESALGPGIGETVNAAVVAAAGAAAKAANAAQAAQDARAPQVAPEPEPVSASPRPEFQSGARAGGLSISILPDLAAGPFSSTETHAVSINLLAGASGAIRGVEVGGLANFESADVTGFQAAGLTNAVRGSLLGFQAAGLVNWVGGDSRFLQTAGLVNVSGTLTGAQVAGLVNVTLGRAQGAQVAGLFNWASAGLAGAQVAGLGNWASEVRGPQISVVNVADTVTGAQVGVVNIARRVTGIQVGVLNFSEQIDGVPLGLISIEARGRHGVDLWVDMDGQSWVGLSLGATRLYTVISASWKSGTDPLLWSAGVGLGSRVTGVGPFFIDADLSMVTARSGFSGLDASLEGFLFPRARAMAVLPLFGSVAVDAGVAVRILVPGLSSGMPGADASRVVLQPTFIAGVQL